METFHIQKCLGFKISHFYFSLYYLFNAFIGWIILDLERWLVISFGFPKPVSLNSAIPSWLCHCLQSCWWWKETPGSVSCRSAPRRRSAGWQRWWSEWEKEDTVRGWTERRRTREWKGRNRVDEEEESEQRKKYTSAPNALMECWTAFCYCVSGGAINSAVHLLLQNPLHILPPP